MRYSQGVALVTALVRDLTAHLGGGGAQAQTDSSQEEAILALAAALLDESREPLGALSSTGVLGDHYPVDADGYAVALDPLKDERRYEEYFARYGFVVGKQVIAPELATKARSRIRALGLALSNGAFDIEDSSTQAFVPRDDSGVPLFSRGFYEVYHDAVWAEIRQSPRLYLHHVLIWGTPRLWTTFDRFGVKPPGHPESAALPLHTDQSPAIHPGFRTIQGIVALSDCPAEIGTTVMVPGSRTHFDQLRPFVTPDEQYVELSNQSEPLIRELYAGAQPVPLRSGDILTWDSRVAHANTANLTASQTRYVALVAAGRAKADADLATTRRYWFESGLGKNVRDAYLHASIRPRYLDQEAFARVRAAERLTPLGERLYGFKEW